MKPTKYIEKLIKNINVIPGTQMEKKTLDDILLAQEKTKNSSSVDIQPNIWRIIMKSRITILTTAASVLIIIGILYVGLTGGRISAAEVLEEIIKHHQDYKGWIHINAIYKTLKEGTDEVERITTGTRHINTIDGTWIWEDKTGSNLKMYYFSPVEDAYIEYDSIKAEVALNDLNSYPAKKLVDGYPLTADARIASFKKATGKDPYDITITQEGDYDRLDIIFFENREEEIRIGKEKNTGFPSNTTLWVDRKTHLIYKSFTEIHYKTLNGIVPGMKLSRNIKYGEPLINNIYDLGVPEDAVVIDHRKTLEVENVIERLKSRIADLNHYVALMTQTKINDDGTFKDSCALHLFAQDGDAWLVNRYPVGNVNYCNRPEIAVPSIKETPENLLSLNIISVLDRIKHAHLWSYFVFDGKNFYSNEAYPPPDNFDKAQKKKWCDRIKDDMGLLRNIWFGQKGYGHETKIKLIKREDKPGEIGLYIEYYSYPPPYKSRHEKLFWFDPNRDDMPIEMLFRGYLEDGKSLDYENRTIYLDYTQLSDGRWCPALWRTTTTDYDKENVYKDTQEYQLTIHIDIELEEDWFVHPNRKTVN